MFDLPTRTEDVDGRGREANTGAPLERAPGTCVTTCERDTLRPYCVVRGYVRLRYRLPACQCGSILSSSHVVKCSSGRRERVNGIAVINSGRGTHTKSMIKTISPPDGGVSGKRK